MFYCITNFIGTYKNAIKTVDFFYVLMFFQELVEKKEKERKWGYFYEYLDRTEVENWFACWH